MIPTWQSAGVFEITSNTLVRSSQSSTGPAGGAPDGYGLGRGAAGPARWRRAPDTAAPPHRPRPATRRRPGALNWAAWSSARTRAHTPPHSGVSRARSLEPWARGHREHTTDVRGHAHAARARAARPTGAPDRRLPSAHHPRGLGTSQADRGRWHTVSLTPLPEAPACSINGKLSLPRLGACRGGDPEHVAACGDPAHALAASDEAGAATVRLRPTGRPAGGGGLTLTQSVGITWACDRASDSDRRCRGPRLSS